MISEDLVRAYLRIRTAREELIAKHKAELAGLETDRDIISAQLLDICKNEGQNGFKTNAGTVSRRTQSRYWASDWELMYEYINEHEAPDLLEQRIHQKNMKVFLEDHEPPRGLQQDSKYVISVRKPTAK